MRITKKKLQNYFNIVEDKSNLFEKKKILNSTKILKL